jgi:hypothetical protein
MLPAHRAYLARETAISTGVNSVLSLAFALLASHGRPALPLWGAGGMAVDFMPQLFMMTFATTVAVTLLTRMRLNTGKVASTGGRPPPLPRNAVLRAILLGGLAVLVLAPLSIGVLALAGVSAAPTGAFILGKVIYGAVVSLLIAPPITLAALASPQAAPAFGDQTQ